MSTIYDIAKKTGYSASTVARALSGNGYCSEKARKVILQSADEMHYQPVQAAKILKNKITKKVMLCIPDIFNPYYFPMIRGVNDILEQYGYYTILVYSEHDVRKEIRMVQALREHFVDGMIIVSFDFNKKLMNEIRKSSLPIVLTNLYKSMDEHENFDCVYVDHTKAVYLATMSLLQNKHQSIAFLGGSLKEQTGLERLDGYKSALSECGIGYRNELVIQSDFSREGGYRDFAAFMKSKADITGVVACNDLMAVGCLNYCRESGLDVPHDISITSLDNTDYCLCTHPQLTSVDMMQNQIGKNAAHLLMERIQDGNDCHKVIKLDPKLVERTSVRFL